jgi:predicted TIM-barrel fold metal-dependent hydrolase
MKTRDELAKKIVTNGALIDCHTHVGVGYGSYLHGEFPYCISFEDMVVRMKYLGIDHAVMMPFAASSYFKINPSEEGKVETTDEFAAFPYESENTNLFKEIYEVFPEYSDMALPFAMFDPSRKQEEQVALLDELIGKYPMFGLKTVTTYMQSFVTDLETTGRAILEFAKTHDLPFILHSSWDKNDPWANIYDLVDFTERNPELRICLAHSARFTKDALDRAEQLDNCYVDLSAFDIHCQLATQNHRGIPPKESRVDLNYEKPVEAMQVLADMYPKSIIWGTDMPYNYFIQKYFDATGSPVDVELKSSFDKEMLILKQLTEETRKRITNTLTKTFLFGV